MAYQIKFNSHSAPTIDVQVGWSRSVLAGIARRNPETKVPGSGGPYREALIDTGSFRSFISAQTMLDLGLKPTNIQQVWSPLAGKVTVLVCPVSFRLMHKGRLYGLAPDVEAGVLPNVKGWDQPIIGRDVLCTARFLYDGPGSCLTLIPAEKRTFLSRLSRGFR